MARTWNRNTEFAGWFSLDDYFALAAFVSGLVTRVDPSAEGWYDADWNDGAELSTKNRDEFNAEIEDTKLDDLKGLRYLRANLSSGGLTVAIRCYDYGSPKTSLAVSGQDRTVVEGIFVQVSEAIEKRLAAHDDPKPSGTRATSESVADPEDRSRASQRTDHFNPAGAQPQHHRSDDGGAHDSMVAEHLAGDRRWRGCCGGSRGSDHWLAEVTDKDPQRWNAGRNRSQLLCSSPSFKLPVYRNPAHESV